MHLRPSLAALLPLSICLLSAPSALAKDEETVSVYLPGYNEKWWSDMYGSVISKDSEKTEYSIFCPTQTPQRCNLAGDSPFTFTEGSETLIFHETSASTFTMNLECELEAQTAATCTGYKSLKSGYVAGTLTGPAEMTWTSTFLGADVVWADITLADEAPKRTGGALEDITATAMETPGETGAVSEDEMIPEEAEGAACGSGAGRWAGVVVGVGMAVAGVVL